MWRYLCLALLLVQAGCTTYSVRAPMGDRSAAPARTPETHQVRRGDTLYSIGFMYGLSVKELAQWNQLRSPYTIYRGQELRLRPTRTQRAAAAPQVAAPRASQPKRRPGPPVRAASTERPAPVVGSLPKLPGGALKPPAEARNVARAANATSPPAAPAKTTEKAGKKAATKATKLPARAEFNQQVVWTWPVKGRVVRGYDAKSTGKKGIDIGGQSGTRVRAAASGKVVYAGSGLSGYGRLIIIKHNNDFLSAYAHNRKLIAREGQWVKKGEIIAQMGSSGTDRPQLHFEIREHGRPVNPLRFLPKR
jgi:lipoprotein NlpD